MHLFGPDRWDGCAALCRLGWLSLPSASSGSPLCQRAACAAAPSFRARNKQLVFLNSVYKLWWMHRLTKKVVWRAFLKDMFASMQQKKWIHFFLTVWENVDCKIWMDGVFWWPSSQEKNISWVLGKIETKSVLRWKMYFLLNYFSTERNLKSLIIIKSHCSITALIVSFYLTFVRCCNE